MLGDGEQLLPAWWAFPRRRRLAWAGLLTAEALKGNKLHGAATNWQQLAKSRTGEQAAGAEGLGRGARGKRTSKQQRAMALLHVRVIRSYVATMVAT